MDWTIPEPCDQRWASMEPSGDGRFCRRCQHAVLDLSRMTRRDAEARIKSETGPYACVRVAVDERDAAMFRPEPSRARSFAGGLVLVAALTAAGCRERDTSGAEPIAEEPCAVEGPPMMPVDHAALSREAPPSPEVAPDAGDAVIPTAEQRELTRRKHARREAAAQPPIRHVLGRMPLPRR